MKKYTFVDWLFLFNLCIQIIAFIVEPSFARFDSICGWGMALLMSRQLP